MASDSIKQADEVVLQMDSVKPICALCGKEIQEPSLYLHWKDNCFYFNKKG